MACELNMQNKSIEEIDSAAKHQHLVTSFCNRNPDTYVNELNFQSLMPSIIVSPVEDPSLDMFSIYDDIKCSTNDSPAISMNPLTNKFDTCDDSCSDFTSAKDFLNNFFIDFDFEKLEFTDITTPASNLTLHDEESASSILPTKNEFSNTCIRESLNITPSKRSDLSSNSIIFQKDLGDLIFLTLKFYKRRYSVHIRQFKRNVISGEKIASKKGLIMDINSWYEFQYKIFAFNLRYKSSSFIANNTILVLNSNNSLMHIKKLKNNSHIELNDYQLENLKEMAYELNKKVIYHMYTKNLPNLIKCKCTLANISPENELLLMSKLILAIEENVLSVLNRIFECFGCIQRQLSRSLHSCFMYNNREKFQQLGDMLLMLVDLDFVTSTFLNRVDCISENFLCNINVETIRNVLFKTL